MKKRVFAYMFLILFAFLLNFVSAYSPFWYSFPEPIDLVNSPWFRFALLFILFYSLLLFSLKDVFRGENKKQGIVISLVCALLISGAFVKNGFIDGYIGNDIVSLLVLLGVLFVFGIVFRWFFKHSKMAAFFLLFCFWFVLFITEPYETLPYFLLTDSVETIYRALGGWIGFGLLLIVGIVSVSLNRKRQTH